VPFLAQGIVAMSDKKAKPSKPGTTKK